MATPHSPRSESTTGTTGTTSKLSPLAYVMLAFVHFYRYVISPLIGPRCRFYPTCSTYALKAIKIHGAIKGGWLALKRILRCNPLSEGGEDPVPPKCNCGTKHK
ncbi:membrane protein insertion efficiency factor YidD [Glaesserella parasuis]|uniref:membrane protein insertion efficiency factor YidD n=1 Tax=Glaesserella parasuis TaxID=738 RepID=UPI00311CABEA